MVSAVSSLARIQAAASVLLTSVWSRLCLCMGPQPVAGRLCRLVTTPLPHPLSWVKISGTARKLDKRNLMGR